MTAVQVVHELLRQIAPAPEHCAVVQQLPATHWPPQQKSPGFALQAAFGVLHAPGTQRPTATLQMLVGPYEDDWHWVSEVQRPH